MGRESVFSIVESVFFRMCPLESAFFRMCFHTEWERGRVLEVGHENVFSINVSSIECVLYRMCSHTKWERGRVLEVGH